MDFLRVIRSSLYDPAFYGRIRTQSISSVIKMFAILGIIGIGILMVVAYIGVIPFAYSHFPDKLEAAYPADLIITVANGALSINQPQPYYVKNSLGFSGANDTKYLAIFDTGDDLSGDLQQNSTFVIIKKNLRLRTVTIIKNKSFHFQKCRVQRRSIRVPL